MEIVYLLIGLGAGAAIGFLITRGKLAQMITRAEYDQKVSDISRLLAEKATLEEKAASAMAVAADGRVQAENQQRQVLMLTSENSRLAGELKNLEEKISLQKGEMESLQTKFTKEFENLANRIFEEKSEKFVRQNRDSMDILLNPLKEKMDEFRKKVEDTHIETTKERSVLSEQLRNLTELNQGMREDANRLTMALKGEAKTQGNWGELILEKILEKSGLTRGQEYTVQESFQNEEGKRYQPDVIIKLPEGKNLVVDSKVSLTAYERISASTTPEDRLLWTKEHVKSIRSHIKMLSEKKYHQLYGINTPDFVLMFVPMESAFATAVQADHEIYNDAFEMNIVIVTTSTLLATLRTISSIWKQEYQNRNVLEIARQGGDLYDKFVSFTEDLVELGKKMKAAQTTYEESMKKLVDGRGNLIRRAETLKELGAKVSKQMNPQLLDRSAEA